MIVHQFVPTLEPGAVGTHTLAARRVLRGAGHDSEIFTEHVHPSCEGEGARRHREYRGGADALVYQMAIGSVVADTVLARNEPIVVNHHNLTPLRYYAGWEPVAAHGVVWGRAQLRELASRAVLGIADSSFNEADLRASGFRRTVVVPVLHDIASSDAAAGRRPECDRPTTWLFVGRLAPNKAQHDVVKALGAYRRFHDPAARLVLVGGGLHDRYGQALTRFVHALGLDGAVSLAGAVPPARLAAAYETADVFVVCSEHEGFCVPLLEAMHHRVPIVAYAAAAVPETLADAGILVHTKDPCTVAAAVHRVVTERPLRDQLVAAGTTRLADFDLARTGPCFVHAVESAVAGSRP